MNILRAAHTLYHDRGDQKAYVVGGEINFDSLSEFDIPNEKHKHLSVLNKGRFYCGVLKSNSLIYVFGGNNPLKVDVVERFDLNSSAK